MSDVEYPEPRDQARTPFTGGGAARSGEEMVTGGLADSAGDDESEPGVRFVAPPPPGSGVGVGGSTATTDGAPAEESA